jgi:hypothetical protein
MTTIPEYLKQIDFYASRLFKDKKQGAAWVYTKNQEFDNMSPMAYIREHGEKGAIKVRDHMKEAVYG